jgi:GDP-D-mannose dehydratase
VGAASKARRVFGFDPQVKFRKLIDVMLEADLRDAAAHPAGGHR